MHLNNFSAMKEKSKWQIFVESWWSVQTNKMAIEFPLLSTQATNLAVMGRYP
jgi:hypothetical protein